MEGTLNFRLHLESVEYALNEVKCNLWGLKKKKKTEHLIRIIRRNTELGLIMLSIAQRFFTL